MKNKNSFIENINTLKHWKFQHIGTLQACLVHVFVLGFQFMTFFNFWRWNLKPNLKLKMKIFFVWYIVFVLGFETIFFLFFFKFCLVHSFYFIFFIATDNIVGDCTIFFLNPPISFSFSSILSFISLQTIPTHLHPGTLCSNNQLMTITDQCNHPNCRMIIKAMDAMWGIIFLIKAHSEYRRQRVLNGNKAHSEYKRQWVLSRDLIDTWVLNGNQGF